MEYIYGTNQNLEILKTMGDSHTDLSGFFETRREYADGTVITDHCRILDHFHSAEQGGVCYDWYTIDSHYRTVEPAKISETAGLVDVLLGLGAFDKPQAAEQLHRALQMFAKTLTEEQALEIATVYPAYEVGKAYEAGDIFSYGTNGTGDPQLYKVVKDHTSQADWKPDAEPSLYDAFGLDEQGYPVWSQPSGAHDAYNTGDIVNYNGTLYKSLIDGNTWSPDAYPAGWEVYDG